MPDNQLTVHKSKSRLIILFIIAVIVTISLVGRLGWIQLVRGEEFQQRAWEQWNRSLPTTASRGVIMDRNQEILVGTVPTHTLYAFPPQIQHPEHLASQIFQALPDSDKEVEAIEETLRRETSRVIVAESIGEEAAESIQSIQHSGLQVVNERKRYYPHDRLASHLLGFVGVEQGWSGLEYQYDRALSGQEGLSIFQADGRNEQLPHNLESHIPGEAGRDLQTTIDMTIQYILERELEHGLEAYKPNEAMGIAIKASTGEVLAMANKPDYHPGKYQEFHEKERRFAPVNNTYEPGSTFKLITLAAAVEEGIYDPEKDFYCSGHADVAGQEISCWKEEGHGDIDFLEVVYQSCNPGFITLGKALGKETLFEYINGFGFGSKSGIDLPGETDGLIFQPETIGPVELATTSFGQGVSVTPIQQAMAVSAIANEGVLVEPKIAHQFLNSENEVTETFATEEIRRVISRETAQEVTELMTGIVAEGGAQNADIDGYNIAGKTGTAQKIGPEGEYVEDEKIVSFIGFAPAEEPEILLYVALDGPTEGPIWGNEIAAPIFRDVMVEVLDYMEIPRDQTGEPEKDEKE